MFHRNPIVSPDVIEGIYNRRKAGAGMTTGVRLATEALGSRNPSICYTG